MFLSKYVNVQICMITRNIYLIRFRIFLDIYICETMCWANISHCWLAAEYSDVAVIGSLASDAATKVYREDAAMLLQCRHVIRYFDQPVLYI
jgi:hypothetical protein